MAAGLHPQHSPTRAGLTRQRRTTQPETKWKNRADQQHTHAPPTKTPTISAIDTTKDQLPRESTDPGLAARPTSRAVLDGPDYTALLDRLEMFLTCPTLSGKANRPARREIATRLNATVTRVQHKGRAALASDVGEARDRALHDARKAAKRSRYAADLYQLINPKAAAQVGGQTAALQDALGDRHDGAVLAVLLRQFAARTGANNGNGFTYGFLLAREEARGTHVEQNFSARLKKLRTVRA